MFNYSGCSFYAAYNKHHVNYHYKGYAYYFVFAIVEYEK